MRWTKKKKKKFVIKFEKKNNFFKNLNLVSEINLKKKKQKFWPKNIKKKKIRELSVEIKKKIIKTKKTKLRHLDD